MRSSHSLQACQLVCPLWDFPCSVSADKRKWDFHWSLPGQRRYTNKRGEAGRDEGGKMKRFPSSWLRVKDDLEMYELFVLHY